MLQLLVSLLVAVNYIGYGDNVKDAAEDATFRACGEIYGIKVMYEGDAMAYKCSSRVKSIALVKEMLNRSYLFNIEFSSDYVRYETTDIQSVLLSQKVRESSGEDDKKYMRQVLMSRAKKYFDSMHVTGKGSLTKENTIYINYTAAFNDIEKFYDDNKDYFIKSGLTLHFTFIIKLQCSSMMYGGYINSKGRIVEVDMPGNEPEFSDNEFRGYFKLNSSESTCSYTKGRHNILRAKLAIGITSYGEYKDPINSTKCLIYTTSDNMLFDKGFSRFSPAMNEKINVDGCISDNVARYMVYDISSGVGVMTFAN